MGRIIACDYLDMRFPGTIQIKARISVSSESSRTAPLLDQYRPDHNFGSPDNRYMFMGQIDIPVDDPIYVGDTREVWITFINSDGLVALLTIGRKWRIQEGGQLIAYGEVLFVEDYDAPEM